MAEDFDVEAMLEAPYRKEEDTEKYNGTHNDKENRRNSSSSSSSKKKKRSRSRSRARDGKRSRSRDRRSRSRDRRSRSRDRRRAGRSRSRDRRRRSYSRERKERRRSRSRSRERRMRIRSRDRRSRSRSPRRDRRRHRTRSRSPRKRTPPRSPLGSHTQFFDSLRNKLPDDDISPEDRDLRTIFCMRLSQRVRARDLEEFFSSVGPVRDVKIIMDNKTRRSKGIAYVEFQSVDSIPLALALNDTELMGFKIHVQLSQAEKNRVAASTSSMVKGTPGPMRLYVGSLHFNITEDMLRGIFEPFGRIERIELIKDTETGRSKGYGFISFYDSEDAKKALEQLNGFELAGRPMKVGHVTERTDIAQGSFLDSDELDRTGIDLGATGRLQLMAKLAEGTDLNIPAAAVSALQMSQGMVTPQQAITPPIATQCFLLSNMFDPATETNPEYQAILLFKMRCFLAFMCALMISACRGSSVCTSSYDFPCDDGECIDSGLWCDSHVDCSDGSDEKYCKKSSIFNSNPNKCPSTYFKCANGPCIPLVGKCDNYDHCTDKSDELDCPRSHSLASNISTISTTERFFPFEVKTSTSTPLTTVGTKASKTVLATTGQVPVTVYQQSYMADSIEKEHHSVQALHSDFQPSEYFHQREKARKWLLSERNADFGWGTETQRAVIALYLSDLQQSSWKNESDMLMVKQLEVQLSLDMERNSTKAMDITDLALYINALLASCKNPKNFYGENLVRLLRNGVDAAQRKATFVNPSVYLTLCINNASTFEDARKLHELHLSRNVAVGRMDLQALAMLTSTCIRRETNYLSDSLYEGFRRQFLQKVNDGGVPGNVYEAAIVYQALHELGTNLTGLLEFILRQQQEDGTFGDVLATYLVLPVLAGRSFLKMNDHCAQRYTTDPAPIEVLKNVKRQKIFCTYTLNYGNPIEITEIIQMKVAKGINFLDVMRLAQDINPKFRFILDESKDIPVVYSIGGKPNDAEKGIFWTLHMASNRVPSDAGRLSPYVGNIKQLIPQAGDEFVFWLRPL